MNDFNRILTAFIITKILWNPFFRELGLPPELMYLSLVESGSIHELFSIPCFRPWQFMKGTGRVCMASMSTGIWMNGGIQLNPQLLQLIIFVIYMTNLAHGLWPLGRIMQEAERFREPSKTGTRDFLEDSTVTLHKTGN